MIKEYARRRMSEIDYDITQLVHHQDALSRQEEERLDRLDRAHKFWQRWAA